MRNSLGYAPRPATQNVPNQHSVDVQTSSPPRCRILVPKGLLPMLFYSLYAAAIPPLLTLSDNTTDKSIYAGFLIGFYVLFQFASNCAQCWFNMVLFYHTSTTIVMLQHVLSYEFPLLPTLSQQILSVIISTHLIPFFIVWNPWLLTGLAGIGAVLSVIFATSGPNNPFLVGMVATSSIMLLYGTVLTGLFAPQDSPSFSAFVTRAIRTKQLVKFEELKM